VRRDVLWADGEGEDEEEMARARVADIEANYERSRRLIRQIETGRAFDMIKEAQDATDFEAKLDE
jgi:hypothetical protein